MATLDQENASRDQLRGLLEQLAGISAADLVRDKDLGPGLNFESGVIFFSGTLRLFHALHQADLQDIPPDRLTALVDKATQSLDKLTKIGEFSLQNNPTNPIETRNQLINAVRDSYDEVFSIVSPILAFSIRKGTDFERLEEQGKAALLRIESLSAEYQQQLEKAHSEAQQLVQEIRTIAAESGVAQHSIHFKQEADQHENSAKTWLTATICLAIATFLVGGLFLFSYYSLVPTMTGTQSLQLAISKIVVISVMFSAMLWTGKTYRAHRHNAVINRHRQNALSTFQAFVKAAADDQTKNAVLLQATQCIFSPQQTGYFTGESETTGIPQVLEVVRNLGKS